MGRAVPRAVRRGVGAVARAGVRASSRRSASCPRARSCHPARAGCRTGTSLRVDEQRLVRGVPGGVRRLPHAHRCADRAPAPFPRRDRRGSTTRSSMLLSDNGTSAEGGTLGTFNEHRFTLQLAGVGRGQPRAGRRARRRSVLQPLPVGLGLGGQHAAATVEALHVAGRHAHAAGRALARGNSRRAARCATRSCT